jgi:cell division protein FtsN
VARDVRSRRRGGGGFSGWLGVVCGLALGLAVAVLVYFKDHRNETQSAPSAAKVGKKKFHAGEAAGTEAPEGETADSDAPESSARPYDFYKMLPKFEVIVPEREKDVRPDVRGVPETRRGTYVLQAGSYKSFADADRVRAQLALQGVESKVQKVSVDNDTWHRIRIGPISQLDELNRLRAILRKADVDVLVIRVGD